YNSHDVFNTFCVFFFNDPPTTEIYTLSLHDALPIYVAHGVAVAIGGPVRGERELRPVGRDRRLGVVPVTVGELPRIAGQRHEPRSEEHTSELQSQSNLVCRLLLEKKKNI